MVIFIRLFVAGTSKEEVSDSYKNESKILLESISKIPNISLVFGGYHRGIMAIAYDEFKNNSKEVVAVSDLLFQDSLKELDTELSIVTENTMTRSQVLYENSDCLLFLPGGIGTYSELFMAIEENKNSKKPKPIILYNYDYFYTPIIKELYHLYQEGFIEEAPAGYMIIESDRENVIKLIEEMK